MPRYNYKCNQCDLEMELVHSMSEVATDCIKCDTKNSLKKQLSIPRIDSKTKAPKNVGGAVKESIEEYKQRVDSERGIWEDFDIEEILKENIK